MAVDLIAAAQQQVAAARAEAARATAKAERLAEWIETAKALSEATETPATGTQIRSPSAAEDIAVDTNAPGGAIVDSSSDDGVEVEAVVEVRKAAYVGRVAKILLAKGPLSLRDIVDHLIADGGVREGMSETTFVNHVNSAIWRRRHDLFVRAGGKIMLLSRRIRFVDG